MKTVLYINAGGGISGAERSLLAILHALDRTHWHPVLAAPDGPLLRDAAAMSVQVKPVELPSLWRPHTLGQGWEALQAISAGQRELRRVIRALKPDILHANTTPAMLFTPSGTTPVIWHVRDLLPLGTIGKILYRRATRIAAISSAVHEDLLQYANDDGRKITMLPPAVDTERFVPVADRSSFRKTYNLPADVPLIGLVAQFVPWKRHHLFLDALERIATLPWYAVLAGADLHGDAAYIDSIRERLAGELADRITILPWQDVAACLFGALDILVLTSEHEPFGRVLIEAMACGVPVVAVEGGGVRDTVLPNETGLLTSSEADDIAAALWRLLEHPELRTNLGQAGRERAVSCFGVQRQSPVLTELYHSIDR